MELTNTGLRVFSLTRSQLKEYLDAPEVFLDKMGIKGYLPETDARSLNILLEKCDTEDMQWYSPFLIVDKLDKTLYGHICYCGLIKKHTVEIGYSMLKEHRNKGVMTEAVRMVSGEALRDLDITRVQALCLPDNPASARVLQKNHFRLKKQGDTLLYVKRSEQRTFPILICALLGVIVGASVGHFVFGSLHNGLNIGIFSGLGLGAVVAVLRRKRLKKQ